MKGGPAECLGGFENVHWAVGAGASELRDGRSGERNAELGKPEEAGISEGAHDDGTASGCFRNSGAYEACQSQRSGSQASLPMSLHGSLALGQRILWESLREWPHHGGPA